MSMFLFFGVTLTAGVGLDFSKKEGLFRVKMSEFNESQFSVFEDSDGKRIFLDIMGDPDFKKRSYTFSNELISSVNIRSHPRLNNVTRMALILNTSKLQDIQNKENSVELRFKKAESRDIPLQDIETGSASEKKYRLGVGDKIHIEVYDNPDLTKTVKVSEDGTISYPFIGDLNVKGKTVEELKQYITDFLSGDYIVDPVVNLSLKEYKSQWAYVKGNVTEPGKVYLKGPTKLVDILSRVGGSDSHMIVITRGAYGSEGSGKKIKVKSEDLYSPNSEKQGILIEHGDLINVPKDFFYISGEVADPGSFPYTDGMTVLKAISKAGGISQWGSQKEVEILRKTDKKQKTFVVNLKKIRKGEAKDMELHPEDHIVVHKRGFF